MAKTKKRTEIASEERTPHENGDARDRIALRAYELYLARGGADGGDFDDWIAAERELIGAIPQPGSDRGE